MKILLSKERILMEWIIRGSLELDGGRVIIDTLNYRCRVQVDIGQRKR
jgi:hypothetical protein